MTVKQWYHEHVEPYHYKTMEDFAKHMKLCHGLTHKTAYNTDRDGLVEIHRSKHLAK